MEKISKRDFIYSLQTIQEHNFLYFIHPIQSCTLWVMFFSIDIAKYMNHSMIYNEITSRIFNTEVCVTQQSSEEFQALHFSTPIFETDNISIALPNDVVQLHGDAFGPANNATQDN